MIEYHRNINILQIKQNQDPKYNHLTAGHLLTSGLPPYHRLTPHLQPSSCRSAAWVVVCHPFSQILDPPLITTTKKKKKMEASDHSSMASLSLSHSSSNSTFQTTDFPPNLLRQWRPNAQRNLKNQWSKLSALRNQWFSSSSSARSHATSLVNSYLSSRYLDDMNLGVLSDMPNIRNKARCKFLKQQELQLNQLLASYKSMVGVVVDMISSSRSLRCYLKATSGSPLIEFTSSAANSNDTGDGGGATVFTFLPISAFEMLAEELSEMFKQELLLKLSCSQLLFKSMNYSLSSPGQKIYTMEKLMT